MSFPRSLVVGAWCALWAGACGVEPPEALPAAFSTTAPPLNPALMKPARHWGFVLVETSGPGPFSVDKARTRLFGDQPESIRSYYREVSYGLQDLDGDVLGPMTFDPSTVPEGLCIGYGAVGAAFRPSLGHYDQYLFYFESVIKGCNWGGVAQVGMAARPAVDSYYNAAVDCVVLIQEPGHNFGMVHSSAMRCTRGGVTVSMIDPGDPTSRCEHEEYGNPFDPMGGGNPAYGTKPPTLCYHMNGVQKAYEEWLDGCNIVKASKSGLFTIYPLETPNTQMQVLEVPLPAPRGLIFQQDAQIPGTTLAGYYLEMRAPIGLDSALGRPRLFMIAANSLREARARGNPNWLIDATPETPIFNDADLPLGRTFEDPVPGGPKITLVAIDNSKAIVRVELDGVASDAPGGGTCLDDTPYVPGVIRVPDAGPDAQETPDPDPDPLPPKRKPVQVSGCAYGGGGGWAALVVLGLVGLGWRRRSSRG